MTIQYSNGIFRSVPTAIVLGQERTKFQPEVLMWPAISVDNPLKHIENVGKLVIPQEYLSSVTILATREAWKVFGDKPVDFTVQVER